MGGRLSGLPPILKMKPVANLILRSCTMMLLLSGCDVGLLGKIRSQLRQPAEFFELAGKEDGFTVRFLAPVIPRASLPALGFGAVAAGRGDVKIPYALSVNGAGEHPVAVVFCFAGDYLQSVTLPVIFYELLGAENSTAILRLMGGASLSDWKMVPISPAKVQAVLAAAGLAYDPQAESVVVRLWSTAPDVRSLVVALKHDAPAANYKTINLSFRK